MTNGSQGRGGKQKIFNIASALNCSLQYEQTNKQGAQNEFRFSQCAFSMIFYQFFGRDYVFLQATNHLVFPATHNRVLSLLDVLANWLIKLVLKQNSVQSDCDNVSPCLCLSEYTPEKCLSAVSAVSASEQPLLLPFKEWDGTNHLLPVVTTKSMSIRQ